MSLKDYHLQRTCMIMNNKGHSLVYHLFGCLESEETEISHQSCGMIINTKEILLLKKIKIKLRSVAVNICHHGIYGHKTYKLLPKI